MNIAPFVNRYRILNSFHSSFFFKLHFLPSLWFLQGNIYISIDYFSFKIIANNSPFLVYFGQSFLGHGMVGHTRNWRGENRMRVFTLSACSAPLRNSCLPPYFRKQHWMKGLLMIRCQCIAQIHVSIKCWVGFAKLALHRYFLKKV